MEEITLSTREFKALSSENRVKILKILQTQNHTLSEIAKKIELSNPSAKQHLEVLVGSGLIELKDEGRKWKYYSLSRNGKKLLEAKERQTQVFLLLSITAIVALGVVFLLSLQQTSFVPKTETSAPQIPALDGAQSGTKEQPTASGDQTTWPETTGTTATQTVQALDFSVPRTLYEQSTAKDCGKLSKAGQELIARINSCISGAFFSCEKAKAISDLVTIEGDRIVTFIEIAGKENGKCKVFAHEANSDKFSGKRIGNFELNCFEINNEYVFASCEN